MNDDSLLIPAVNMVGAVTVLMLWGFPSIFFHELGDTVAARLLGLKPTHLVVGEFDSIFSVRVFDIDVVFRLAPIGGATLIDAPPTNKVTAFVYVISGPISNALIIFAAVTLWPHTALKAILATVILIEVIVVIENLIPRSMVYEGVAVPSDGKRLLQIFFRRLS